MSSQDIEERREYYRIEDRIALQILPREHQETSAEDREPALFELFGELHRLDFEAQLLLRQIAENDRTLANYLKVQNKRIELLGQAIASNLLEAIGPARTVMLSEAGIDFQHDQPLAEGESITLKLVLMPLALGLRLPARVLRCSHNATGYAIAAAFESLSDAQRQFLARHILQKQALERRLAKERQEQRQEEPQQADSH
ncbi:PilZ domain-containing protein [Stutzerimonas kirkiae]|uniref:Pilus assembly protein PilZ n=1 Tax=Stutzerimonas kirkiae TaxID=2211392 RepID=A0A4Q9RAF7_9GAMM|nr:PilZ domain-containing protein [Stutzerimonas kirkiae]TBU97736.1 pilus assembly protein PilZ [Stutzerimonas kirkiae]TBV04913.1 pilus assembly protein PilZ [Stutzerimonas kirkiae]TBV12049.1 pilus assembly protein PilZ [Stutzerimonas kirkiae]